MVQILILFHRTKHQKELLMKGDKFGLFWWFILELLLQWLCFFGLLVGRVTRVGGHIKQLAHFTSQKPGQRRWVLFACMPHSEQRTPLLISTSQVHSISQEQPHLGAWVVTLFSFLPQKVTLQVSLQKYPKVILHLRCLLLIA